MEGIAADAMEYEKKLLQAQEKLRTECEFLREAELQLKDLRQVASEKVTELEQSQSALAQKRTQQLAKQLAEAGLSQYSAAELESHLSQRHLLLSWSLRTRPRSLLRWIELSGKWAQSNL